MKLLYVIVAVAFIDTFSQLPIIAPYSIDLGATSLQVGLIIGIYSFANMIGNILSGILIDRKGPNKILPFSMIIVGCIIFIYTFITSPYQLLVVRFLHGFASGFIVPAAFTLIGKGKQNKSGKTMAFSGATIGLAAIVGPAYGAIITSRVGVEWLFLTVAFAMLLIGILSFKIKENNTSLKPEESKKSIAKLDVNAFLPAYISIFLLLFTLGTLTYGLPLKVEEYGLKQELTGLLLSTFGLVAILIFVLPSNRIFDKKNPIMLMNLGLGIITISIFTLAVVSSVLGLIGGMILFGIGFSFIFPSTSSTIITNSNEQDRGLAFGLYYACFSFGVITGSFFAGLLDLDSYSLFSLNAFLLGVSACLFYLWKRKKFGFNNDEIEK